MPGLRAEPLTPPSLPAYVFMPSDDIQYMQAYGVLGMRGFAADLEVTYYYRDASPFQSSGATQDEIAAVRGKTLIREADWQRFVHVVGERNPALLSNFKVSNDRYLIGGVLYLAVSYRTGNSSA